MKSPKKGSCETRGESQALEDSRRLDQLGRRGFLGYSFNILAGLGLGLVQSGIHASQKASEQEQDYNAFVFSRFKFQELNPTGDRWDVLPEGDEALLTHVRQVTNTRIANQKWEERVVSIDDFERYSRHPFLFMTGQEDFHLNRGQAAIIGEYLKRGGFLYADDCVNTHDSRHLFFHQAFRREIQKALPDCALQTLAPEHRIFHCFYTVDPQSLWWDYIPKPTISNHPHTGVFYKDRMVCFLTGCDLHCSWARRHEAAKRVYQQAIEMGTNIIIYALTH